MTNYYLSSFKQLKAKLTLFFFTNLLLITPTLLQSQCTPGNVLTAHTNSIYDFLDPDADGYISETGAAFTSDTTEMIEFEVIPNSTTGWISITDVSETDKDVTPACGNTDLVNDRNGGDFAFYNILDPTPGSPTSGDEYIIMRFRLSQDPNGNFGYNFLFDTDNNYGATIDPNALCGNQGFEREVQYANAGGKKGVSVYDVDGSLAMSALSPACSQCVPIADIQISCAAIAGDSIPGAVPPDDDCNASEPVFVSFGLALSYIGVGSDILPEEMYIATATASSGNATSVLGGGNVTDFGGIDGDVGGCPTCVGLTGCAMFDCQTDCINVEFQALLPIELSAFNAKKVGDLVQLDWTTQQEVNNDYFVIQRSFEGRIFEEVGEVAGAGNTTAVQHYGFVDKPENSGTFYYRLKQVDFDGTISFSSVRTVTIEQVSTVRIIPTAVRNEAVLAYHSFNNGNLDIKVIGLSGSVVYSNTSAISKGNNEIPLDLDTLPAGLYFVNVFNHFSNENNVVKLIKM